MTKELKQYVVEINDYSEKWYLDGNLHREGDLPAVVLNWDDLHTKKWFRKGLLHRDGAPAIVKNSLLYPGTIIESWYQNGALHREDGPAYVRDAFEEYWLKGKRYDSGSDWVTALNKIKIKRLETSEEQKREQKLEALLKKQKEIGFLVYSSYRTTYNFVCPVCGEIQKPLEHGTKSKCVKCHLKLSLYGNTLRILQDEKSTCHNKIVEIEGKKYQLKEVK